jgi:hypothetical protein
VWVLGFYRGQKTPAHIQVKTGGEKRATKIWLCLERKMKPTPGARQTEEIEQGHELRKEQEATKTDSNTRKKSQILDQHKTRCKLEFSIQIQTKIISETTEVTVIPPLVDY